ncbi:MAG: GGDEF domain-containing protein [Curvibacter sp.]|nr:GGDEF domain-containing protein [Curvibacter sp.]
MAIWHQEVWTSIEQSVDSPDILALLRLWQSLRPAEGAMPALASFSIDGPLAAFAAQVTVFEPEEDGDYRVYYCGDEVRRDSASDPSGQRVGQTGDALASLQLQHFQAVTSRAQPVYVRHFSRRNPCVLTWERLVMPLRDDDGRVWIVAFNQATEARARLLETVLDGSGEAVLVLRSLRGPRGELQHWLVTVANTAFSRLAGALPGRQVGALAHEAFAGWPSLALDADCRAVVGNRAALQRDLSLTVDQQTLHFALQITPLLDGCVVRLSDVTAARAQEQALRDSARQLQADNEELRQQAWLDGLTGLLNRRALDTILEREVARAQRLGEPLALVMCDIDHFKAFNDFYGHLIGDDCLREVGQVLGSVVQRATDMVARYGGEEFTLVLPNTDLEGGLELVQRIQQSLHDRGLPDATSPNGKLLTLSFGVAQYNPRLDTGAKTFLERADAALYRAKHQGRNRVGAAFSESFEVSQSSLTEA